MLGREGFDTYASLQNGEKLRDFLNTTSGK